MKVKVKKNGSRLEFIFHKEPEDIAHIRDLKIKMTDELIYIEIGEETDIPHPDIIAVATILMCNPFVGRSLYLPFPVSKNFITMASSVISKYEIFDNSDNNIIPLENKDWGVPGLAFSGGADSCAALQIMPKRTVSIFLKRPVDINSLYDLRAPMEICKILKESGYDIHTIETNLEKIRNPIGFPTDLANAIPAIILSDSLNLDSIAFGTVLESAFGIGHENYIEYGKSAHWKFYSILFNSIGINMNLPVSGISEVGTAIISQKGEIANISQSCIRGVYKRPCLWCWKCFRKELLVFSLDDTRDIDLSDMLNNHEVQIRLSAFPISHENVINYSLRGIELSKSSGLNFIKSKMDVSGDYSLFEKWYSDSQKFIPEKYVFEIRDNIMKYLEPMSLEENNNIKKWNMANHLNNKNTIKAQEKLIDYWQDIN